MSKLFNKSLYGVKLWWVFIPLLLGFVFLIIGSFADLSISQAIVNQDSRLAVFGEGIGTTIPFLTVSIGASMLAGGLWQAQRIRWKVIGIIMLCLGILIMGFLNGKFLRDDFTYCEWFKMVFDDFYKYGATLLGMLIQGIVAIPLFFYFKKQDPTTIVRIGIFIIAWIAIQSLVIEMLKYACYRPRYRWLAGYSYDDDGIRMFAPDGRLELYRRWYEGWTWFREPSFDLYGPIGDMDNVKSWPSGHSASATLSMSLPLIIVGFGINEEKKRLALPITASIGFLYFLFIAYARVLAGAHFLSDVSTSLIISSIVIICVFIISEKLPISFRKVSS